MHPKGKCRIILIKQIKNASFSGLAFRIAKAPLGALCLLCFFFDDIHTALDEFRQFFSFQHMLGKQRQVSHLL